MCVCACMCLRERESLDEVRANGVCKMCPLHEFHVSVGVRATAGRSREATLGESQLLSDGADGPPIPNCQTEDASLLRRRHVAEARVSFFTPNAVIIT